jgi:phospholipid-translocating P-type ATPase (flippase)
VDGKIHDCKKNSPLLADMKKQSAASDSILYQFMLCLTTCHTVIREKSGTYRAESPDELALVEGANLFECGLVERGTTSMVADMMGKQQHYDVLAVNQFNSDRKRMSILIKDSTTGQYVLMCKGADNVMLPLCNMPREKKGEVEKSLLDLACLGLRTLVIARKVLSEQEAIAWAAKWKKASTALQDRAEKLVAVGGEIEQDMELLGVTAIEDRLQDEVPEAIADFLKAGIIFWMLTGDKEETAINIGHSCNLLQHDTQTFFITRAESKEEYVSMLTTVYDEVLAAFDARTRIIESGGEAPEIALVMDGPSFVFFDDQSFEQRAMLLQIGKCVLSVIACRLTPVQKQMLVKLVKVDTVPKATTLAIGDGANDVSMIREGDVGVGIFGKEGRQAANNADFAIGQFKFLKRLLLVHGRWNYIRQSKVFLYSMHKNMVITLTLFYFSYMAAVSGTSMYESYIYSLYNFALGLPIVFLGIFNQDISAVFAMAYPQVYSTGLTNSQLDIKVVMKWIWNAILYGIIFSVICFAVLKKTYQSYDLFLMGTMTYISLVLSMHLKVAFIHRTINQVHFWAMFISVSCLFFLLYVLNLNKDEANYDLYYVASEMYQEKLFWYFSVLTIPVFTIMIDLVGLSFYVVLWPSNEMLYTEASLTETPHLVQYRVNQVVQGKEQLP